MTVLLPYTDLLLSSAFKLSQFNILFYSIKIIKTECYILLIL